MMNSLKLHFEKEYTTHYQLMMKYKTMLDKAEIMLDKAAEEVKELEEIYLGYKSTVEKLQEQIKEFND